MATPHVTGAAALLKSENSSLDDAGLKTNLLDYSDTKTGLSGKTVTGGRVNAAQSLSTPSSSSDTAPPTVSSRSPSSGQTGVRRATNVTATFSEEMAKATLTTSTVTLVKSGSTTPLAATVTLSSDGKTVTLDPSASLARRTTYTVKIEGAKDLAGNPLATTTWSFKTGRK